MDRDPMAPAWHYSKQTTSGVESVGPLSWEELYRAAQAGELSPGDAVWNPGLAQWVRAAEMDTLFPGSPPTGPLAQHPPQGSSRRRLPPVIVWVISLVALVIVGAGLGIYFGAFYHRGAEADGTDSGLVGMGVADCKAPARSKLIETTAWGEVPADQIIVTLADGRNQEAAAGLAEALGGSVVGEIEFINAYQIETTGSTEADLQSAIDKAAAFPGVEFASPNMEIWCDTEFRGVRQTPLDDPAYSEGRGSGFELIGAQKAWDYIRGSEEHLWNVHVGVVDEGLFRGNGEFSGAVYVDFPDPSAGALPAPLKHTNNGITVDNPSGSHGTMVTGLIGADFSNGGITGVASMLGTQLTISSIDFRAGKYGISPEVSNPDPNDPTVATWVDGKSHSFGGLAALVKQIDAGAKVINCSWGSKKVGGDVTMHLAGMYRKFLERMAAEHPDVVFVCAAGNDGSVLSKTNMWPAGAGSGLPNVITVGNVNNDGSLRYTSNVEGPDGEVTLAAPGHEVVKAVDAEGNPITNLTDIGNGASWGGGTSAAAPQVTGAVALLLSLDPRLTAAEIKDILVRTARPGPPGVGGRILAVDQAVLEVINRLRDERGLPPLTSEELEKAGTIDAVATSTDQLDVFSVRAILDMVPAGGAEVTISGSYGVVVEGDTSQWIDAPGEVVWPVVKVNYVDPSKPTTIIVTRKDNGAASVITINMDEAIGWQLAVETVWDDSENADRISVTWKSRVTLDPEDGTLTGLGDGTWRMDGSIYRDRSRPELGFEGTMSAQGSLTINIRGEGYQTESGWSLRIEPSLYDFVVQSQVWSPASGMEDARAEFESSIESWVAYSLNTLEFDVPGNNTVSITTTNGAYVGTATLSP